MPEIKAKGDWWEIRQARLLANDETATDVYVYGDIGESWWDDSVTAKEFVQELDKVDSDVISVRINSYGGSVSDGLAIYNAIRRHNARIDTYNDGVAMSIASLILMAGDVVHAADNSITMIHAPWTALAGNAPALRNAADVLDTYAQSMASAYARNGFTAGEALALLQDGEDHTYTAEEAQAAGFVDDITQSFAVAAQYRINRFTQSDVGRISNQAATAAQTTVEVPEMDEETQTETPDAAESNAVPQTNVVDIQEAAISQAMAGLAARNQQLRSIRAMSNDPIVHEFVDQTIADPTATMDSFFAKVNDHRGQNIQPINKPNPTEHIESVVDSRDKFREGAAKAIAARIGVGTMDRGNELRGKRLYQLAEMALVQAGIDVRGLTANEIARRVVATHSTSDFPLLLADAANKKLQAAYEEAPSSWQTWCMTDSTSDFKQVNLLRLGSFSSLDVIPEGEQYTQGTFVEEGETLTPYTVGKYISMTRQMLVNDDLSAFGRRAAYLGTAAGRTVNEDVYAGLLSNPTMSDGTPLFDAGHNNILSPDVELSVGALGDMRSQMRRQKGPGDIGRALDIMPRTLLVPVALEDSGLVIVGSQYDPDDTGNTRAMNPARGRYDVVSEPLLDEASLTAYYLVAAPNQAPLMEVHFLDGNQTPFIDEEIDFMSDAIRMKVRLDYGVAANDWRGGQYNAGTTAAS